MHAREVKFVGHVPNWPTRLVLILCSQREQILPLSRLDVKIFRGYCPSYKFTNFKVDSYELIQVICLAAEDVNTRNNQSVAFWSPSYIGCSAGNRAVSLLQKVLASSIQRYNPAICCTIVYCYSCGTTYTRLCGAVAYYVTRKPLCSVGWGGGVSSGHKCKISIKRPPLLFRELQCKKGGRIIEQVRYKYYLGTMIDHFPGYIIGLAWASPTLVTSTIESMLQRGTFSYYYYMALLIDLRQTLTRLVSTRRVPAGSARDRLGQHMPSTGLAMPLHLQEQPPHKPASSGHNPAPVYYTRSFLQACTDTDEGKCWSGARPGLMWEWT